MTGYLSDHLGSGFAFFGRAGVAADGLGSAFFAFLETRPEPAEAWSR
jgi:hypothetical protein